MSDFGGPQTSHDARESRGQMSRALRELRDHAKQVGKARSDAEHLYKREHAKAHLQIDAPNAEKREAQAYLWELPDAARDAGLRIAQAGGMGDHMPTTVGEVRHMRDRLQVIEDHAKSVAYDAKEEYGPFTEELRMVRQERDQAAYGLQETA